MNNQLENRKGPHELQHQHRQDLKVGDVDPRGNAAFCSTISEKARAIGGSVLEGILRRYNR